MRVELTYVPDNMANYPDPVHITIEGPPGEVDILRKMIQQYQKRRRWVER